MKIGVRSVFSGVVGGTAGAVSKITGGFGKVLAKMTYDEEFQRKRIEGIKKRKNQAWPLHSALLFKFLGRYIYCLTEWLKNVKFRFAAMTFVSKMEKPVFL